MRSSDQVGQTLLQQTWRTLAAAGGPAPSFDDVWFRDYSQNGEDGILLYLFSLIGTTNRLTVEMCAGNGVECNSANLILNHGFWGLLFDGDSQKCRIADDFYGTHQDSANWKPAVVHEWITRDNVNKLISARGIGGEIDLFVLDMDGNDYWVLEALDVISPRVIVAEMENAWGWEHSFTQPYVEDFRAGEPPADGSTLPRYGVSLPALVKLCARKGYRLVGAERYGINAFFVRNDIEHPFLPEVDARSCFRHDLHRFRMEYLRDHFDELDMGWWVQV